MKGNISTCGAHTRAARFSRAGNTAFLLAAIGVIVLAAPRTVRAAPTHKQKAQPVPAIQTPVARGEYLVKITGCNDCHTPMKMGPQGPEPDMSRMLSGHPDSLKMPPPPAPADPWTWSVSRTNTAFAGPWGITFATNLTPDENTGMINTWSEIMFIAAMRNGKHMDMSRAIMPPMPWADYGQMTDDDLKAIFAYLHTIPPVKNLVPLYQPPSGAPKR